MTTTNAPMNNAPLNKAPMNNAPLRKSPMSNTPLSNASLSNAPMNKSPVSTTPTSNNSRNDQERANAQLKEAVLNKKRVQIEAWSAQIEQLQEGMSGLADAVRSTTRQRLDDLSNARNQATAQLEQLQQSSQENWDALLEQSDAFFHDLADRFHRFASKND